jgi:hypothetical protein
VLRFLAGFVLLVSPAAPLPAQAQNTPTAEQKPKYPYFSGTITALDEDKVTVIKTVLGKNSETRTFLISKDTRIEGKLKLKVRVTVRYTRDDDGYHALHIIVRTVQKK